MKTEEEPAPTGTTKQEQPNRNSNMSGHLTKTWASMKTKTGIYTWEPPFNEPEVVSEVLGRFPVSEPSGDHIKQQDIPPGTSSERAAGAGMHPG